MYVIVIILIGLLLFSFNVVDNLDTIRRQIVQQIIWFFIAFTVIYAIYFYNRPLACLPNCAGVFLLNQDLTCLPEKCTAASLFDWALNDVVCANLQQNPFNWKDAVCKDSQLIFINADLRGSSLSEADLSKVDFSGADLTDVNLRGANLSQANFIGANLSKADLREATLNETNFRGANLTEVDLTGATLQGAMWEGAILDKAKLTRVTANTGTNLAGIHLTDADLSGAILEGIYMSGADLNGINLSDANLTKANLRGVRLNLANVTGANLRQANLSGASLIGTNMSSVNLDQGFLIYANIIGADFSGANLVGTNLSNTRLFPTELIRERDLLFDPLLLELNELQTQQLITHTNMNGIKQNEATILPQNKDVLLGQLIEGLNVGADNNADETQEIRIGGSSTVTPLTLAIYSQYFEAGFQLPLSLSEIDTGLGIMSFCQRQLDIVMASRPMTLQENQLCANNGLTPIAFQVGLDAIMLVTSQQNNFAKDVTSEQIPTLFSTELWQDVNQAWPDREILHYLPQRGSGTFDFFVDTFFRGDSTSLVNAENATFIPNNEERVDSITNSPAAVGLVPYATYRQNETHLHVISIDGVNLRSKMSANDTYTSYPLSRPLYLYADIDIIQDKSEVASFLRFYMEHVSKTIESVGGYFNVSQEVLDANKERLDGIIGSNLPPGLSTQVTEPTIRIVSNEAGLLLTNEINRQFAETNNAPRFFVHTTGTASGFTLFCDWQAVDIVIAERPIRSDELERCAENDYTPESFPVSADALVVIVNLNNRFVNRNEVTTQQIVNLFQADNDWSDVNPDWPVQPIRQFILEPQIDAFHNFVNDQRLFTLSTQQYETQAANLIRKLINHDNSIGFVAYPNYIKNNELVQAVAINGIYPAPDNIINSSYPFAHTLYLYVDSNTLQNNSTLVNYVRFYLDHMVEVAEQIGYPTLPLNELTSERKRLTTILSPE